MRALQLTLGLLVASAALVGCRGWTSDEPPVHLNPNMDTQAKLRPYRASDFFADGRGMRTPPAGTIARTSTGNTARDADFVATDEHRYTGMVAGAEVTSPPAGLEVNQALLERGRDRYNIFCAPCHAQHGDGQGTVASRLTIKPPTFHDDLHYKQTLGYFYRIITHGKPLPEQRTDPNMALNMPSYAAQVSVEDRWAIALYIRALQRTTHAGPLPTAAPPAAPAPTEGEGAEGAEGATEEGGAEGAAEAPATDKPAEGSEATK
jgi:mono/diheme cytochrome c family protein